MRIRPSDERGQTASEYLGLLLLVGVLVAALGQLGLGGRIGGAIEAKICEIARLGCPAPAAASHASSGPSRAAARDASPSPPAVHRAPATSRTPAAPRGAVASARAAHEARSSSVRAFSAKKRPSVKAFTRAVAKFVHDLPSSIRSAVRAVKQLFARSIKAIKAFIEALLHPRPPKISPNDPHVQRILAFIREFAYQAAISGGASNAKQAASFIRRDKDTIRDAVTLYGRDHLVGRAGAYLIARGVRNPRLRETIIQLYRPGAKIGDGSTMDALEAEVRNGVKVNGRYRHLQKAIDRRNSLTRKGGVLSEKLSPAERKIAGDLVKRLNRAIAHAKQ